MNSCIVATVQDQTNRPLLGSVGFILPHTLIIAASRLTRCAAVLRWKLPVTASCPAVYGRALLSAHSANVPSSQSRMPQTNKSRNAPASDCVCSVQAGASADDSDPVPREESRAAGDTGGGGGGEDDNHGDRDIIKSPSDPKQYR